MPNQIRQLAAIMFTDIVGYTSLMGNDEHKAMQVLRQNRKIHQTIIKKYKGKWLKEMGDGTLASYTTISDAVYCAGELIKTCEENNIPLRIGIHQGEIVEEKGDIFGDGVNVASRIEPLAKPGQILVSGQVHRNIKNKPGINSIYIREFKFKNVDEAVSLYQVEVTGVSNPMETASFTGKKRQKLTEKRNAIILISVLAIILLGSIFLFKKYTGTNILPGGGEINTGFNSIAVLAFEDLSPQGDQEYLGDGIAEEIINVLTRIERLKVIGRTSSFSFKNQNMDLISIGQKLGVSSILEGSVRKSNNKIRITAQLINAQDGSHLWSETYDRELDDIFTIQDDISKHIADKFQLTLSLSQEDFPLTRNIDAYEMYLEGIHWRAKGITGVIVAIEYFEKAIAFDPNFALAYVKLSESYWASGIYGLADRNEYANASTQAALKAIELDPNGYEGYSQLSWNNFSLDFDWTTSLDNYNKAVERGLPIPDMKHLYYKSSIYGVDEFYINEAQQLIVDDPLSEIKLIDISRLYLWSKQYEEVIQNGQKVLAMNPENTSILRHMASAYLYSGDIPKAYELYERLLSTDSAYAPQGYIATLVRMSQPEKARSVFNRLSKYLKSDKKAMCYIHFGELDSAFFYLNKAFHEKDIGMIFLKLEPHYDLIRDDPRYSALLDKMKFPEE